MTNAITDLDTTELAHVSGGLDTRAIRDATIHGAHRGMLYGGGGGLIGGAAVGSVAPFVGTGTGAVLGGLTGALGGGIVGGAAGALGEVWNQTRSR